MVVPRLAVSTSRHCGRRFKPMVRRCSSSLITVVVLYRTDSSPPDTSKILAGAACYPDDATQSTRILSRTVATELAPQTWRIPSSQFPSRNAGQPRSPRVPSDMTARFKLAKKLHFVYHAPEGDEKPVRGDISPERCASRLESPFRNVTSSSFPRHVSVRNVKP